MNIFLLIIGIVLMLIGCFCVVVTKNKYIDFKFKGIFQAPLIILGIALIIFSSSFKIIPTGYTGVKTTFGQINKTAVSNGFNWKIPFVQSIDKVNNKQQDINFNNKIWSESSKRTAVYFENVVITYSVNPQKSAWIYANVNDYEDSLISNEIVSSAIKSSSKTLSDENVTDRSKIEPLIQTKLQEALDIKYDKETVFIHKVVVNNIDFEDSYNKAIASKQNAQLESEKQSILNKKAVEKADADAKVKVKTAEADAQAKKIAANAEAESNEKINKSLSDNILKKKLYDKWNGELPKVEGSNSSIINLEDFKTKNK